MGAGLQCPTCKHLHPLAELGDDPVFACGGCGRMLSVPATIPRANGSGAAPPYSPPSWDEPTRAHPPPPPYSPPLSSAPPLPREERPLSRGMPRVRPTGPVRDVRPPSFVRALVWMLALGLGLVITAVPLRLLGLLHADQVIQVFAGEGLGRFAVLVLVLPLWAAASATLAHVVLEGLTGRPTSDPFRRSA